MSFLIPDQQVRPKKEFRGQFYWRDVTKNMYIAGTPESGMAPGSQTQWVRLKDDDGNPIKSAFENTFFSANWIESA